MYIRFIIGAVLVITAAFFWWMTDVIPVYVIGQPSQSGRIQRVVEQPFFENLARETGLALSVRYVPLDKVGFKDSFQLSMLKDHKFDIVSLRFLQNSAVAPELMGIDLPGLNTDFKTGREVVKAYSAVIDRALRDRFDSKLLGIWPAGPQVFFCRRPLAGLRDLVGLKVRAGGATLVPLLQAIGAVPVVLPFEDTKEALRIGLVDCAVTSSGSANSAGWPEYLTHYYPLTANMGLNGYAVNLAFWNKLSNSQQAALQMAFDRHVEAIWAFSERLSESSAKCNTGGPCEEGTTYHLNEVALLPDDTQRLRRIMTNTVLGEWEAQCNKVDPGCSRQWHSLIDPIISRQMSAVSSPTP